MATFNLKVELLTENSVMVPDVRQHLQSQSSDLQNAVYTLNQRSLSSAVFSMPEYVDSGIKGCKWEWLLSPLYHIMYSQFFCFPSRELRFAALNVFVPKGWTLLPGDTTPHALNWKRGCHLAVLDFLCHTPAGSKRHPSPAGVTDPNYQEGT